MIETHISRVFLTGALAYKIKRPVTLPFLDFGSLERRRAACEDEVRLNRRLAPELYLGVVAVNVDDGGAPGLRIDGEGRPVEYAVQMRQFPDDARLDRVLARGELTAEHLRTFATRLAEFHQQADPVVDDESLGTPEQIRAEALANLDALEDHPAIAAATLAALREHTERELARLRPVLAARRGAGRVRECHGDLHLENLVLREDRVVAFDCIEFSRALRVGDVMSEVAFTLMDLEHRGRPDLGVHFLDAWLAASGDYLGMSVLRLYLLYRALVRAKVARIRADQRPGDPEPATDLVTRIADARAYAAPPPRAPLVITHGLSGSGKSFQAARLTGVGRAVRIRSDVERKRLLGDHPALYGAEATSRTYEHLAALAVPVLESGHAAIVDATFIDRRWRDRFHALADSLGVPLRILWADADEATLRARIAARARRGDDPSDADLAVLEWQRTRLEPLAAEERALSIRVEPGTEPDATALAHALLIPVIPCIHHPEETL
ncbi:MAG: AAA family ATPase [Ectothiorhodospiraceae bacterium]|nr:AAA family ATPase [Chromatiales bacterium]MCP5153754.1 AAA family ATPase [Ectothiorhodospiraceae bacterium]